MNPYAKVIACLTRVIAVALMLQSMLGMVTVFLINKQLIGIGLLSSVPTFVLGLLLYLAALPLTRLITWGIR